MNWIRCIGNTIGNQMVKIDWKAIKLIQYLLWSTLIWSLTFLVDSWFLLWVTFFEINFLCKMQPFRIFFGLCCLPLPNAPPFFPLFSFFPASRVPIWASNCVVLLWGLVASMRNLKGKVHYWFRLGTVLAMNTFLKCTEVTANHCKVAEWVTRLQNFLGFRCIRVIWVSGAVKHD